MVFLNSNEKIFRKHRIGELILHGKKSDEASACKI